MNACPIWTHCGSAAMVRYREQMSRRAKGRGWLQLPRRVDSATLAVNTAPRCCTGSAGDGVAEALSGLEVRSEGANELANASGPDE